MSTSRLILSLALVTCGLTVGCREDHAPTAPVGTTAPEPSSTSPAIAANAASIAFEQLSTGEGELKCGLDTGHVL
jgi:hypothetical protein